MKQTLLGLIALFSLCLAPVRAEGRFIAVDASDPEALSRVTVSESWNPNGPSVLIEVQTLGACVQPQAGTCRRIWTSVLNLEREGGQVREVRIERRGSRLRIGILLAGEFWLLEHDQHWVLLRSQGQFSGFVFEDYRVKFMIGP